MDAAFGKKVPKIAIDGLPHTSKKYLPWPYFHEFESNTACRSFKHAREIVCPMVCRMACRYHWLLRAVPVTSSSSYQECRVMYVNPGYFRFYNFSILAPRGIGTGTTIATGCLNKFGYPDNDLTVSKVL